MPLRPALFMFMVKSTSVQIVVGLSNILDGEIARKKPAERPHREVVGTAVMDSELLGEVIEGVETVTGVKALLVLPVASLDLAVVARCVGTDELVADL